MIIRDCISKANFFHCYLAVICNCTDKLLFGTYGLDGPLTCNDYSKQPPNCTIAIGSRHLRD
jgi:hypothetical protein